jgi:hypothetical protein
VLRIGGEVFVNGEKLDSPHRPALDAIASHLVLTPIPLAMRWKTRHSSRCWPRWSTAATGSLRTESS